MSKPECLDFLPHNVLDDLGVGVSLIDLTNGRLVYTNQTLRQMLGYLPSETLDTSSVYLELLHPDDRHSSALECFRLSQGEIKSYQSEIRYLIKGGAVIWTRTTIVALKDQHGAFRWGIATCEDITATKLAQDQLNTAEQIAGLTTWKWAVASDTPEISKGYEAVFGSTVPRSIKDHIARIHPDDKSAFERTIQRSLAYKQGYSHEYRIFAEDGTLKTVRGMAKCLFDAAGNVTHLAGATLDITRRENHSDAVILPDGFGSVVNYIETHWRQPISVAQMATECGISARSIHNGFAAKGITPMRYVKQIRLRRARDMLCDSHKNTSVTNAAFFCGFTNLGHFAKDYRIEFDVLPIFPPVIS